MKKALRVPVTFIFRYIVLAKNFHINEELKQNMCVNNVKLYKELSSMDATIFFADMNCLLLC